MTPGQRIAPDTEVRENGAALRYQGDGNLVLYGPPGALWSIDKAAAPGYVEMQHDGNFCAYDAAGTPYWASDTFAPGAVLHIRRTGLQIVAPDGAVVWDVVTGWEEPARGPHPDPLVGQLRVEGGAYVDDTGPRLPVFLHLGDLIGHGLVRGLDAILPALDFAVAHGYHGIRSWFQLLIPSGTWLPGPTTHGWDPRSDRGLFVAILQAAADRGLKWHIAGGGTRGMSESDERDVFGCLSDAIAQVGPQAFALVEGINEARDTARLATPPAWMQVLAPLRDRHPQPLYGLSAYTGHESREPAPHDALESIRLWTPTWMPFYLVHGYRGGRAHDKIRHIFSVGYDGEHGPPVRRVGWQGEPWGPGRIVSAQAGHHEIDGHTMSLGACMAAVARQGWVVMSGPGVVYGSERLEDMPGLAEVPAVVRQLPQDLMRFRTLGHSGPTKRGLRIHAVREDARDVREDYAIANDGRFVAVRYGPPEQRHDLPRERVVWDETVYHEGPWGSVFGGRLA